jgi:hypothetical protein
MSATVITPESLEQISVLAEFTRGRISCVLLKDSIREMR